MNKYKPLLFAVLFIAAVAGIAYCNRKPKPEPTPAPANSEANRTRQQESNNFWHQRYLEQAAKNEANLKRFKADSTALAGKLSAATTKARQSARNYAKSRTLANCDTALFDCQQETKEALATVANRDSTIKELRSLDKIRVAEIDRQKSVIDSAFTGWGKANTGWAEAEERAQKWGKKVKRRGKIITIGAAIVAAIAGGIAISR